LTTPLQYDMLQRSTTCCNAASSVCNAAAGTTVSQSLTCPADEVRMIVSLDMKLMNR
jgi:hypothetical protein